MSTLYDTLKVRVCPNYLGQVKKKYSIKMDFVNGCWSYAVLVCLRYAIEKED